MSSSLPRLEGGSWDAHLLIEFVISLYQIESGLRGALTLFLSRGPTGMEWTMSTAWFGESPLFHRTRTEVWGQDNINWEWWSKLRTKYSSFGEIFTDHPLVSDLPGDRDFMLSIFPKFILFRSSSSCKSHQGVQFAATLRVQRDALNRLPVTHICGVQFAATKDGSLRSAVRCNQRWQRPCNRVQT